MITAKASKRGDYYKAVLLVEDGAYKKTYYSKDSFMTRKVALRQASFWKHESLELGQIIKWEF